eukprot:196493_1
MSSIKRCMLVTFITLCIFTCTIKSEIATPTANDSISEIYDTSITNKYENMTIICTRSICKIICDEIRGCFNANINANASTTLILSCSSVFSCKYLNILSAPQTLTNITCINPASCQYANFNVYNTATFNLLCTSPSYTRQSNGTCRYANIFADRTENINIYCSRIDCEYMGIHAENVTNSLNVNCNGSYTVACQGTDIYCPIHAQCNIICEKCNAVDMYVRNADYLYLYCYDIKICGNMKIYCGESVTHIYPSLGCSNDACCPSNFYSNEISCSTSDCTIDCVTKDCRSIILNGSLASSLTVNCNSSNTGCELAHIYCPTLNNGTCTINCFGNKGCYRAFVHGSYAKIFNVQCNGKDSCRYGNMLAMDTSGFNLICNNTGSCISADIYCPLQDECNITCSGYTCNSINIHIKNKQPDFTLHLNTTGITPGNTYATFYCDNVSPQTYTLLFFADNLESYGCGDDLCCPDSVISELEEIQCNKTDCVIDCTTKNCDMLLINGSLASSLTVYCNSTNSGGCNLAHIHCPIGNIGTCKIYCFGNRACASAFVKGLATHSLHVYCDGYRTCWRMNAKCPVIPENNSICFIQCHGESACTHSMIMGQDTNLLNIDCKGVLACEVLNVYCPYDRVSVCNIDCSGELGICELYIYVRDDFARNYVNITGCPDNDDGPCKHTMFACSSDGFTYNISTDTGFSVSPPYIQCYPDDSECCPWFDTSSPTEEPTTNPTGLTAEPSTNPTTNPTRSTTEPSPCPTINPTYAIIRPTTHFTDNITVIEIYVAIYNNSLSYEVVVENVINQSIPNCVATLNANKTYKEYESNILIITAYVDGNFNLTEFEKCLQTQLDEDYGPGTVVILYIIIEEENDNINGNNNKTLWGHYTVSYAAAAVFMILLLSYCIYNLYRKSKIMQISNPLIIMVAIGIYDDSPVTSEVDGEFKDLNGLDIDVRNVVNLFREEMNYCISPAYSDINIKIKQHWTKESLINLLKENAKYLRAHIDHHDALMVIISCHGMDGCIITSDYKKIPKNYVHRLFSIDEQNVGLRTFPRLFYFDCCDGIYNQHHRVRDEIKESDDEEEKIVDGDRDVYYDLGKQLKREVEEPWAKGEKHPDHKLGIINASATGFQSKMRLDIGSYMIDALISKLRQNNELIGCCKCKHQLVLGDIMAEIQSDLEQRGKQLLDFTFNNQVEKIIFLKNRKKGNAIAEDKRRKMQGEIELMMMRPQSDIPIHEVKQQKSNVGTDSDEDKSIERMYDKIQTNKYEKQMDLNLQQETETFRGKDHNDDDSLEDMYNKNNGNNLMSTTMK